MSSNAVGSERLTVTLEALKMHKLVQNEEMSRESLVWFTSVDAEPSIENVLHLFRHIQLITAPRKSTEWVGKSRDWQNTITLLGKHFMFYKRSYHYILYDYQNGRLNCYSHIEVHMMI